MTNPSGRRVFIRYDDCRTEGSILHRLPQLDMLGFTGPAKRGAYHFYHSTSSPYRPPERLKGSPRYGSLPPPELTQDLDLLVMLHNQGKEGR